MKEIKEIKEKSKEKPLNCKCTPETMKKIVAIKGVKKWNKIVVVEEAINDLYNKIFG